MGHVVVELEVVVDNCVLRVIELKQMLERSSPLLMLCLDIMNVDWLDVYYRARVASENAGNTERKGERRERGKHDCFDW